MNKYKNPQERMNNLEPMRYSGLLACNGMLREGDVVKVMSDSDELVMGLYFYQYGIVRCIKNEWYIDQGRGRLSLCFEKFDEDRGPLYQYAEIVGNIYTLPEIPQHEEWNSRTYTQVRISEAILKPSSDAEIEEYLKLVKLGRLPRAKRLCPEQTFQT